MTLRWTENTKPDRPGIWFYKTPEGTPRPHLLDDSNIHFASEGTWVYHGPKPDIQDPEPRYRDVTAADVGKMVEGRRGSSKWRGGYKLAGIINGKAAVQTGHDTYMTLDSARIIDDGKPVKQADPDNTLAAVIATNHELARENGQLRTERDQLQGELDIAIEANQVDLANLQRVREQRDAAIRELDQLRKELDSQTQLKDEILAHIAKLLNLLPERRA